MIEATQPFSQSRSDDGRHVGVVLTAADIAELKTIYRRKYGEDLSDDDAWELGNRLIRLFTVLTREPGSP